MFDRDLVQLLLLIPRSQMQKPGRRRALVRSAMKGIVPEAILERKRKAFLEVRPQRALAESPYYGVGQALARCGFVDATAYREAAQRAASGTLEARVGLLPAMTLEAWLESRMPNEVLKMASIPPALTTSAEVLGKF